MSDKEIQAKLIFCHCVCFRLPAPARPLASSPSPRQRAPRPAERAGTAACRPRTLCSAPPERACQGVGSGPCAEIRGEARRNVKAGARRTRKGATRGSLRREEAGGWKEQLRLGFSVLTGAVASGTFQPWQCHRPRLVETTQLVLRMISSCVVLFVRL